MSFSHPCITLASGSKQTAGVFIQFPENQLLRYKYCLVDDLVNFGYKQQRATFFSGTHSFLFNSNDVFT